MCIYHLLLEFVVAVVCLRMAKERKMGNSSGSLDNQL